jgi:hypothetical protein
MYEQMEARLHLPKINKYSDRWSPMEPVKSKILPPIKKSEKARRETHTEPVSEHILWR